MESYLEERFGGVQPKNSSEEALRRWRRLCSVVKNPKRRFRFTANLEKRGEAEAIKHANHVRLFFLPDSRRFSTSLPPSRRRLVPLGSAAAALSARGIWAWGFAPRFAARAPSGGVDRCRVASPASTTPPECGGCGHDSPAYTDGVFFFHTEN